MMENNNDKYEEFLKTLKEQNNLIEDLNYKQKSILKEMESINNSNKNEKKVPNKQQGKTYVLKECYENNPRITFFFFVAIIQVFVIFLMDNFIIQEALQPENYFRHTRNWVESQTILFLFLTFLSGYVVFHILLRLVTTKSLFQQVYDFYLTIFNQIALVFTFSLSFLSIFNFGELVFKSLNALISAVLILPLYTSSFLVIEKFIFKKYK